jgi:hypothetical protein
VLRFTPDSAQWRRDLVVSHWKIAELLEEMPDRQTDAEVHWSRALAYTRVLADTGRLAPADAWFIQELERRGPCQPPIQ